MIRRQNKVPFQRPSEPLGRCLTHPPRGVAAAAQAGRAPEPNRSLRCTSAQAVKARFEAYRHKHKATHLQVVLESISAKHSELPEIIKDSTVSTAPVNPLFPADPSAIRFLGGGSVQISFSPTAEQEQVIDRIGAELGFDTRSTWIAPALNAFLPGRRDS